MTSRSPLTHTTLTRPTRPTRGKGRWPRALFAGALALALSLALTPELAEARRSGFSSSRSSGSRSSSSRSSGSRSSSSGYSSRGRAPSKGGGFSGSFRSSSSLGSRPAAPAQGRPSSGARSSRGYGGGYGGGGYGGGGYGGSSYGRGRSGYTGYQRPRYNSGFGSWWRTPSRVRSGWRSSTSYRWRFRDRYYSAPSFGVGVWDLYFLSHAATDLFWYHHWQDEAIQRALYTDHVMQDAELARLEESVRALEAQGVARDPSYLPEGIAPQDAYTDEYLSYVRGEMDGSSVGLILLVSIFAGALGGYLLFFRRR